MKLTPKWLTNHPKRKKIVAEIHRMVAEELGVPLSQVSVDDGPKEIMFIRGRLVYFIAWELAFGSDAERRAAVQAEIRACHDANPLAP